MHTFSNNFRKPAQFQKKMKIRVYINIFKSSFHKRHLSGKIMLSNNYEEIDV